MCSKEWQLGAFVVIGLGLAGCGSGDRGSDDGGSIGGFDVDRVLRACTVLHSCFVGLDYEDIGGCVADFKWYGTPAQVDCVLAASVANCTAAGTCVGEKLGTDSNCVDRCLDDQTLVQCNGPSMHREINCPTYLRSVGPQCIVGTGRVGCGVGTCSTATCDGSIWHSCGSGIEGVLDCAPVGTECSATNGCVPPKPGTCTIPFGCEGDLLCNDNGTTDCTQVVPDGTCITINNFIACGWATQCSVSSAPNICLGATLRSCVLGAIKDIDCTTIGGTQCVPNPNRPGAWCSL